MVTELLRDRPGRGVSASTWVSLFALFAAALGGAVAFAIARWRSIGRWPLVYRLALVVVSVGGSCAWWWINGAVEGPRIAAFSRTHGLTAGDLLVAPALLFAAALLVSCVWPYI